MTRYFSPEAIIKSENTLSYVLRKGFSLYRFRLWLVGKLVPKKAGKFARGWCVGLHTHSGIKSLI